METLLDFVIYIIHLLLTNIIYTFTVSKYHNYIHLYTVNIVYLQIINLPHFLF